MSVLIFHSAIFFHRPDMQRATEWATKWHRFSDSSFTPFDGWQAKNGTIGKAGRPGVVLQSETQAIKQAYRADLRLIIRRAGLDMLHRFVIHRWVWVYIDEDCRSGREHCNGGESAQQIADNFFSHSSLWICESNRLLKISLSGHYPWRSILATLNETYRISMKKYQAKG